MKLILYLLAIGIGVITGGITSLIGASGVMILLALIILMSFPLHKAIGTSTLIMAITALSSTIGYAARGNINLTFGMFLAIGSILGGVIGSRYANKVNEKTLQRVVGICFMAMGAVMTAIEIFN